MSQSFNRGFPEGSLRISSGCQYCAVGCGYNALLVPVSAPSEPKETLKGIYPFITPAMTGNINFKGNQYRAAMVPDSRCDLNKGNHSVRGGSQGENLVSPPVTVSPADNRNRSTKDRLTFPKVRLSNGCWHKISWKVLDELMARLIVETTGMKRAHADSNSVSQPQNNSNQKKIHVSTPEALGVKLYEYQFLENTYAATKLFYSAIGTPNVAYHDRPSAAGSSPGLKDTGMRPHDFAYEEAAQSDVLFFIGTNPYENQSVFFMQYCAGKEIIVLDPRRTATAQYAERSGGLHLQPKLLGADSRLIFAICREILIRWKRLHNNLDSFPWRDRVMNIQELLKYQSEVTQAEHLPAHKINAQRRRASRATDFDTFANKFLLIDQTDSPYNLTTVGTQCGISMGLLDKLIDRLFDQTLENSSAQPKIGICYEKGLIWGFNYHNTAAVAALGILLGAGSEIGRFVGRVGGHQKGWAMSKDNLSELFCSSRWDYDNSSNGQKCHQADYSEGYPFRNSTDRYCDNFLSEFKPDVHFNHNIPVHHNLDNHVFGPPENFKHSDQSNVPEKYVRLKNNLITQEQPDVKLLWIIGNNYLGQTNDAQRKREILLKRKKLGGKQSDPAFPPPPNEGEELTAEEIVSHLKPRIQSEGLILIHQELFPNATTELCDIVIPAAGWGEDPFCRYNAQRRLKLYDRFQDSPLDSEESVENLRGDPAEQRDNYLYSPKPDWLIFRNIAHAIGKLLDGDSETFFTHRMRELFPWKTSAEVADDMAKYSHRGQAVDDSLLGDILNFAEKNNISNQRVHTILGAGENGTSQYLNHKAELAAHYVVKTEYQPPDSTAPTIAIDPIYCNGVATNGVMLPAIYDDTAEELQGTWRVERWKPEKKFCFIQAPWSEIEPFFEEFQPAEHELFITNGRFNHLWNNMFHHLRNDYINDRYPEDLPGTILEVNPQWAESQGLLNGQVVDAVSGETSFRAILSKQCSLPHNGGFALFSYPMREKDSGAIQFDGFANNISSGYTDGINPIGALKYSRAKIVPVKNPHTGGELLFPRDYPNRIPRPGPTFASRNQIITEQVSEHCVPPIPEEYSEKERIAWQMKELVVSKGLARVFAHTNSNRWNSFFRPEEGLELISTFGNSFLSLIKSTMTWDRDVSPLWDQWRLYETAIAQQFVSLHPSSDSSNGDTMSTTPPDPSVDATPDFGRIKEIFDAAVTAWKDTHGREPNFAGHGATFGWETRQMLSDAEAYSIRLIDPAQVGNDQGTNTALVQALRDPDGYAGWGRMPKGGPYLPDSEIAEIINWIDAGMPD